MADETIVNSLKWLLLKAQEAHYEAFKEQDGHDPEWPLWYAEFLLEELRPELSIEFTNSQLVYLLLTASNEQPLDAPGMSWADYVARFLSRRYQVS